MKFIKKLPPLFFISILLIPLGSARADAAPPMNPPGGNVSPEGQTQVEMLAEQVIFDFRQSSDGTALVTTWFLFRNTGTVDEHLAVRFPLNGDWLGYDTQTGEDVYPLIRDFTAWIGNQQLPTQTVIDTDQNASQYFSGADMFMYWSVFDMDFPVETDVKLTVKYTVRMSFSGSLGFVYYFLATGAGWKNSIGIADIIFRFPYIMNEYNTYIRDFDNDFMVVENEVRIHKVNLEPDYTDNIRLIVIKPQLWQDVLQRRLGVISSPDDPNAWLELARAYYKAGESVSYERYCQMYTLAFQRVLALNPNDANLHSEFASGLFMMCSYYEEEYAGIIRNEIATALELDLQNQEANNLIEFIKTNGPDLLVSKTPAPSPTLIGPVASPAIRLPSITPLPAKPSVTPTPTLVASTPIEQNNPQENNVPSMLISFVLGVGTCLIGVFVYNRVIRKK